MSLSRSKCSVADCSNRRVKSSRLFFFKFPKDETRKAKWISVLTKEFGPKRYSKSAVVCSSHFRDDHFTSAQKVRLNKNAVLTLDLKYDKIPIKSITQPVLLLPRRPPRAIISAPPDQHSSPLSLQQSVPVFQSSLQFGQQIFAPQNRSVGDVIYEYNIPSQIITPTVVSGSLTTSPYASTVFSQNTGPSKVSLWSGNSAIHRDQVPFQTLCQYVKSSSEYSSVIDQVSRNSVCSTTNGIVNETVSMTVPDVYIMPVPNSYNEVEYPCKIETADISPQSPPSISDNINDVQFCLVCNKITNTNNITSANASMKKIRSLFHIIFNINCESPFTMEGDFPFCSACLVQLRYLSNAYEDMNAYRIKFETLRDSVMKLILKTYCEKRTKEGTDARHQFDQNFRYATAKQMFRKFQQHLVKKPDDHRFTASQVSDESQGNLTDHSLKQPEGIAAKQSEKMYTSHYTNSSNNTNSLNSEFISYIPSVHHRNEDDSDLINDFELDDMESETCIYTSPFSSKKRNSKTNPEGKHDTNTATKFLKRKATRAARASKKKVINYRKIPCPVCHKVIYKTGINCHMLRHAGVRAYQCNKCEKSFFSQPNLIAHQVTHEYPFSRRNYYCSWCCKEFRSQKNFLQHVLNSHINKEISEGEEMIFYHCDAVHCTMCFHSRDEYYTHLLNHSSIHHKCSDCDKYFAIEEHLNRHIENIHKQEIISYCCKYCVEEFPDEITLQQHQQQHHVVVNNQLFPFLCDFCGQTFRSNMRFQKHKSLHDIKTTYSCQICGKSFGKSDILDKHLDTHVYANGLQCYICSFLFTKRWKLMIHIGNHEGQPKRSKDLICKFCSAPSQTYFRRLEHYAKFHPEEYLAKKPFLCDICHKNFYLEEELKAHKEITHDRAKCEKCGKQCTNLNKLKQHLLIHFGEKFNCSVCSKSYSNMGNLSEHMWTHKNERPYNCTLCYNVGFMRKKHLEVHIQKFHKNAVLQCIEESLSSDSE